MKLTDGCVVLGTIIATPKIPNPIKTWGWVLEYLEIRKMY